MGRNDNRRSLKMKRIKAQKKKKVRTKKRIDDAKRKK